MTTTSESAGPRVARRRSPWSRAADAVLNVLAALGTLCIVLVILAVAFNVTLIMFKTGSMAPTIPAGSLAVVREIPATEIEIGDVVTVDRPGDLPVTHRVIRTFSADGNSVLIETKGDANETADPAAYRVEQVREVLWSVPRLAYVVRFFANPFVLGSITLVMAAIVVAAFWPRSRRPDEQPGGEPATTAGGDPPPAATREV